MKTIKAFVKQSHLNEALIRAVIRQCGDWDSFKELAQDVSEHGANVGFSGFIYYNDTVKFATKNKSAILSLCNQLASDLGCDTAPDLIAGFNCIGMSKYEVYNVLHCYDEKVDDDYDYVQVYNALAWFALEEVARSYTDLIDQE